MLVSREVYETLPYYNVVSKGRSCNHGHRVPYAALECLRGHRERYPGWEDAGLVKLNKATGEWEPIDVAVVERELAEDLADVER